MHTLLFALLINHHYICEGTALDGSYKVNLTVEAHQESYIFKWANGTVGKGILKDDQMAVLFRDPKGILGIIQYKVSKDTLEGRWSTGDRIFSEDCTQTFGFPTATARR